MIGCTQPRRIAAINVAKRIAQELNQPLGQSVGYKIRFEDKTLPHTCIKLMTDGILLAETQNDRLLKKYDTIIVDEAHERSLNIDFTLGILRQLVKKRNNLHLIITSATIDTEKFSKAFDNAPVIEVSGRTFPVETIYRPIITEQPEKKAGDEQDYVEAAAHAVDMLLSTTQKGDILIFMPTEQDIGDTLDILRGRDRPGVQFLPLFARLSAKEQSKIFSRQVGRKVIVSTNVAETSLTIPGITYVVDTGLARIPSYSPRTRTTALPVTPISQSSANQRQGRCGRVQNGVCIRLYDQDDFNARPFFTSPEILRSNLAEVILRMIFLKLGDVTTFPFIDPPSPKSIQDGFNTLLELGAIREKSGKSKKRIKKEFQLTQIGKIMAKLPIDPKLSRILIEADRKGCLKEACIITTALAISDPRQRPSDKSQAADQQHARFKDPTSDFITLLTIWNAYKDAEKQYKSRKKMIRFCQDHFLSVKRMREWNEIRFQIDKILKEYGITGDKKPEKTIGSKQLKSKAFNLGGPLYIALHQSLLTGYLANIAHRKEKNTFLAAKGQQAMIFPGSGLFNTAGNWIVAAEFVKTSQLFARTCANIDPAWVEPIAKNLCTYTWSDPHWEKKQGQVMAVEQVGLFGLILISGRKVAYGKINPLEAADIFIRHALVRGEIFKEFEFMAHNRQLIERLEQIENKLRKRDILATEDDMFLFYQSRLPRPFYNIHTFTRFLNDLNSQDFLKMTLDDLQKSDVEKHQVELFPDALAMPEGKFKLGYAFNPGAKNDGITINVPAESASLVNENRLDALVPGLFEEKIQALIRALPKQYRTQLMPVSEKARIIATRMTLEDRPLFSMLSEFIKNQFDLLIPAHAWSDADLPDHLKMRISIRDAKNNEITAHRGKQILRKFFDHPAPLAESKFDRARKEYERHQISKWDFPDLKTPIVIDRSDGFIQKGFLALTPVTDRLSGKKQVDLKLYRSPKQAAPIHNKGVAVLIQLLFPDDFKALRKDINRSAQLKQIAPLFNGQTRFQASVYELIMKTVFEKNIQTKEQFIELSQNEVKQLYPTGQTMIKIISTLGDAYQVCFKTLQDLSFKYQKKPRTFAILTSVFNDLKNLVPPNFCDLYAYDKICHLHRYISGYRIRAQKAVDHPLKDEQKAARMAPYQKKLDQMLSTLTADSSSEKSIEIELFFWRLEEFKLSLFAQEIKTRGKISAKKLDQHLTRLTTMI
jgi:ATP-dependent helicase HrpA